MGSGIACLLVGSNANLGVACGHFDRSGGRRWVELGEATVLRQGQQLVYVAILD